MADLANSCQFCGVDVTEPNYVSNGTQYVRHRRGCKELRWLENCDQEIRNVNEMSAPEFDDLRELIKQIGHGGGPANR